MTVLKQQLQQEINPAISNHAAAGAKMIDDPFLNYFALGLLIFVVELLCDRRDPPQDNSQSATSS
jgi:hypothetical protein